jgi:hypothetical protein
MTAPLLHTMSEEISKKLGDNPFYTLRQLTSIGFFGSLPAARLALRQGLLPFVRISPRRFVIPREAVLDHLRKNLSLSETEE